MLPIQALWEKHLATPFPAELAIAEIEGMSLALIEAAAAECIGRFLADGSLDLRRTALLGLTFRHITVIRRSLTGAYQDYFLRLEDLAYEVLIAVRDSAPVV
ncbi:MAG TPA: hypothetical protein VFY16_13470 [Gemmatimonadaceae bacterium]|nr:hypothetical protein [Gemmatimonadaceae bacterium]